MRRAIVRDGEAMVFHDNTLDRVTEASGPVKALSAKELQKVKLKRHRTA